MKKNNKFTIVANPFVLPFEEIMLMISQIPNDTFGFIGGIDAAGKICVPEDRKLYRGKPLHVVSDSYDTEDFDLSLSPYGWFAFEESRTTIREYLFQIYKILRSFDEQLRFYRPKFEDYSDNLRVAYVQGDIITIKPHEIPEYNPEKIGYVFSGGGGTREFLTVLPIPNTYCTFEIIGAVLQSSAKHFVKYIVTSHNYSYRFCNKYIESCPAPIINFLESAYDCLLIEGSPTDNLEHVCSELGLYLDIPTLNTIPYGHYKNVRSAMSDKSHDSVWLFVFDFMNYKNDTDIISGSQLYGKHTPHMKTIRVGL
jgi:hypothetical protein